MANEFERIEQQWNEQADEWNRWIGDDGDRNRRESSDIYLWKYIGDVDNNVILDAGCGNGYLTIKFALETSAKRIFAVDLSRRQIEIATDNVHRRVQKIIDRQRIELHHDSIHELQSIENNSIDLIVANYVLMDTPDLDSVIEVDSYCFR
jgi:SAM-dependent methyltransferase